MRAKTLTVAAALAVAALTPAIVQAATPSFVVHCMRTSGPVGDDKYGTFYFFLKDGFVKGFACGEPGRPCRIVAQDAQQVVFQTWGDAPDTLSIDLTTGSIQQSRSDGLQWTFACKQVPYRP